MESPSQCKAPPVGALGEGVSPDALRVNILAADGSCVSAPVLVNSQVHGDVLIKVMNDVQLNTDSGLEPTLFDYKESIRTHYKRVQEYNSLPAEDVLLTDRYTDLLMVQNHRQQKEREVEISFRGASFFSAREAYQSTTVDQFFSPDDRGDVPRAVILQGHSGHGKSFTVQKIMLDWASGNLYQDRFELILHLRCKELNQVSGKRCVVDLVSCSQKYTPLISQKLKDSPQKALLLIDGFDELQFPMDEISDSPVKDLLTPAPVEATLSALLKGSILLDCFLLVSTRPTAADTLSKLLKGPQRSTEILGFSESGVQEYFQRFCQDQQVAEKAFSSVKANETLFTSCSIPVICWIVCTVFWEQLKENAEMAEPETTTSIFVDFVSTLLEHHCQHLSQPVPTLLRSLGQLAERGMLEQRVLFEKESVESKISDLARVPFLCKFLLKKKVRKKEMFSFMHLSFQEFFTALYYTFDQNEEKVEELLKSFQGGEMKSHLLPVIQFLFGLSNREVMQDLEHLKLPSPSSIRRQLEEWMLGLIKGNSDSKKADMTLFILHCLYELHEGKPCEDNHKETPFVCRAMEAWGEINFDSIPLTRTDCWVLRYCLQCCPTIRSLELNNCNMTADKLRMLQPALSRCEELGFGMQDLSDVDVGDLISALGEGKILHRLYAFHSSLSEESVQQIFSALYRQKSVGRVGLTVKTITLTTAERLLQFYRNTQIGDFVGVGLPEEAGQAESLCSVLVLRKVKNYFGLLIGHFAGPAAESSGLKLILLFSAEMSSATLSRILQAFHPLRRPAENPEYDECVDALMAHLSPLPDLMEVTLSTGCLTEIWANRILTLIHTCPQLREVQFGAAIFDGSRDGESGLLLEEGVRSLKEARTRPGCKVTLHGKRCSKPADPCTRLRDRELSCNNVSIVGMKTSPVEDTTDHQVTCAGHEASATQREHGDSEKDQDPLQFFASHFE
ncbi:NACHT, LRR and PYD domains-containing protein 1 homolog isoform X2 [Alosa sapidissima]|uniref:NACHT, LRR and PYD domains-containing protein 1 homolog isoform X2 n=1 Tax=Alosa sapidissima TaxID=34773 RepID=UPI001C083004|nr:NACHT, LRR and PYD domains-containing protein 1 homolog isoform X2 [Alosa sapidissima]